MKNDTKYKIADIIARSCYNSNNVPSYSQLIECIYENSYKCIHKCPTSTLLLGGVSSFIINDLNHANGLLSLFKEVIQEALELSGIELTFTDDCWDKLRIIENSSQFGDKYILSIDGVNSYSSKYNPNYKAYMSQFFEF